MTLLTLCWKKSLTTQKTTTLAVHFTNTHPKAANFWHVWLYWADLFHASGHKAASTSEQGKHYNSLQCLPLQLLPSSGLHSLMTQYLAACCKSLKKKNPVLGVRVLLLASNITVVWKDYWPLHWAGLHQQSCFVTQPTPSSPLLLCAAQALEMESKSSAQRTWLTAVSSPFP